MESIIFFAFHSSGDMDCTCPCLYDETNLFASSKLALETNRVLRLTSVSGLIFRLLVLKGNRGIPTAPIHGEEVLRPHLGSAMSADCLTRPQYVDRLYWDAGRSLFPGNEADMPLNAPTIAQSIDKRTIMDQLTLTCCLAS